MREALNFSRWRAAHLLSKQQTHAVKRRFGRRPLSAEKCISTGHVVCSAFLFGWKSEILTWPDVDPGTRFCFIIKANAGLGEYASHLPLVLACGQPDAKPLPAKKPGEDQDEIYRDKTLRRLARNGTRVRAK